MQLAPGLGMLKIKVDQVSLLEAINSLSKKGSSSMEKSKERESKIRSHSICKSASVFSFNVLHCIFCFSLFIISCFYKVKYNICKVFEKVKERKDKIDRLIKSNENIVIF
ncbi:hypothetical protein PIB30_051376 [Stylosanthes scabra]|uniref:Uncharacterized protein n=1 Tax=Stylosanthes scabra TaxID=79078 RepID=A0ABU6RIM7_9FABA|nr:hypothetical protein [Stylosanthes scabra]